MRSEQTNELVKAFIKAKAEMKPARKSGANPHFRSTYSTLQDLIDATKGALANNDLAVVQLTSNTESGIVLETYLMHGSGQWIQSEWPVTPDKTGVQALGSALTYARRYSCGTITGQSPKSGSRVAARDIITLNVVRGAFPGLEDGSGYGVGSYSGSEDLPL